MPYHQVSLALLRVLNLFKDDIQSENRQNKLWKDKYPYSLDTQFVKYHIL